MIRAALLLLVIPLVTYADDKPNTLTPKEIEEGWILLFDGETTFGWKAEGDVKVEKGMLILGGGKGATLTSTSEFPPSEVKLEFRSKQAIDVNTLGIPGVAGKGDFNKNWNQIITTMREQAGSWKSDVEIKYGKSAAGRSGRETKPNNPVTIQSFPNSPAEIRSIKLRPLAQKPLFNGKDLTGWKVFDDAKKNASQWSVTKEGWLNVKNGPGDLQTEGKYANFLLQFECLSNGKALNSGVFFRCIPGEYQNGYEAQVQNAYKDDDRTKPADFGTGAIYRRVPARKVVSNDGEWFTMTVLANGDHISTWVNGYQTVDWTDDRPADPNPRKGLRKEAGHLSIQGHDPTTDLSFRNLRIAEIKK